MRTQFGLSLVLNISLFRAKDELFLITEKKIEQIIFPFTLKYRYVVCIYFCLLSC